MSTKKYNKMEQGLTIKFASGKSPRVRKVVSRSNCRVTGKFPSEKNNRMMHWESFLEWYAFLLLEYNRNVITYQEQPATITYYMNGEKHRHIPDIYVVLKGRKVFIEVKTDKDSERDDIKQRTELLKRLLPNYGYEYQVMVESEIKKEPRLSNVRFIIRHSKTKVNISNFEILRKLYMTNICIKWGDVFTSKYGVLTLAKVCRLIIDGVISIPINKVLNKKTGTTWNVDKTVGEKLI